MLTFSAITPENRGIKTGVDQIITCTLAGLGAAADVKWIDPDGAYIPAGDSTNYIVDDGQAGFYGGSQTMKLTLKQSITADISTAKTYQCSVTPLEFSGTEAFKADVVVTQIGK